MTAGALPGVTRQTIIDLAGDLGYPIVERNITPYELFSADEVFLTGTAAEVVPVREISSRPIGSGERGPVTARLAEEFDRFKRDPRNGVPITEDIRIAAGVDPP